MSWHHQAVDRLGDGLRVTARAPDGVVEAVREVGLAVPLVVRLEGTNVELGKQILDESGLDVVSATDMKDGAQKILELSR